MKTVVAVLCSLIISEAAFLAQAKPETRLEFDVASLKENKSNAEPSSNFPLNSGDFYVENGGLLSATNWPLVSYIFFAYKLQGNQGLSLVRQLPSWVMTERF